MDEELNKAWSSLIEAMLKLSDKSSDYEMDLFNETARTVNNAVSKFKSYHLMKE